MAASCIYMELPGDMVAFIIPGRKVGKQMMVMGLAVLLAFGLAASVTACRDVNTGEDKKRQSDHWDYSRKRERNRSVRYHWNKTPKKNIRVAVLKALIIMNILGILMNHMSESVYVSDANCPITQWWL